MTPIRTILHPTDFSPHSEAAFALACSLARDHGARVIVLHVQERSSLVYSGVMTAPPPPPPTAEEQKALEALLHQIRSSDSKVPVDHLLEEGDPATAILQVAQERGCDLIVMGTHGRTGLGRLLMGSVAEKVVREARCPVMTMKIPLSQTHERLAELARQLSYTASSANAPSAELAYLTATAAQLVRAAQTPHDRGMLAGARDRFEETLISIETKFPTVAAIGMQIMDTLAELGI
jgi:universal stress protein A